MAAAEQIDVFRGDNDTLLLTVLDDLGVAVDLTGARVQFSVRENFNTERLIHKDSQVGVLEVNINDPVNGLVEIFLVPADTQNLKPALYKYDVEVKLSGGDVHTVSQGVFKIKADVTY